MSVQVGVNVNVGVQGPIRGSGNQNIEDIRSLLIGIQNNTIREFTPAHQDILAEFLGIPTPDYSNLTPEQIRNAVNSARAGFEASASELGIDTTRGRINVNSSEYEGMSIQDKIFALMLSAIEKQEKSLESRFEQIAGQREQMDTFNAASEQLNALAGQLDPAKPDATVDISEATIQITGQDGNPQTVNLAGYLRDSGLTLPEDLTKVNRETLSGIQSAVKDRTESISSTSQTDLLKLQTESSKLSRLYDMTTQMMKNMADSLANIVRNL